MESLKLLLADTLFRLSSLDFLGILDLALVAVVFFALLLLVGRSQAAFLLRGALLLVLLLLVITVLLPLPTFDWLVRAALLIMLVAAPIMLQPELRRLLERIGRMAGLARTVRQTTIETILPRLLYSVETLAANRIGALIVLEGNQSVDAVIDTGIPVDSQVSQELIQTIFSDKTPLHDGALIMRRDRIVAASCVLPLTEQRLTSYRRLGTRHRSAVGMSERSDALVIVVSEETGHISVAHGGRLSQRLDGPTLRQMVYDFYSGRLTAVNKFSLAALARQLGALFWERISRPSWRQLAAGLALLLLTAVLTITVWSYVIEQTNPTMRSEIGQIDLRLEGLPPDMAVVGTPPAMVSAVVRTTTNNQAGLAADDFQAVVSLAGLDSGLHQLLVTVNSAVSPPANRLRPAAAPQPGTGPHGQRDDDGERAGDRSR